MKNILLAIFILTTSLSVNAWVSDNQAATKQIRKNAIVAYEKVANEIKESWAKKRASDIAKAKEKYDGRYKGVKLDILELNRDEYGETSDNSTLTTYIITYTFLIYEQTIASFHRNILNDSLSSAVVTCKVSATEDDNRTVKIEDQKCIVRPSKLANEALN